MSNPGWYAGMAGWNKTMECTKWTEDWRPCEYPYTGLSAYTADAEYCFQTFAEGIPDEFVYFLGQLAYAALYLPFALMFGSRVLYMLVDLQVLACPVPFHPADQKYTRKNRVMNIHDQCNLLTLLAATIQSVRFLDLHAWQGIIPFAVYQLMGRVVRTLSVTVGSIIIKIWMNLISFWTPGTNTTSNSEKKLALLRDVRVMNVCIVLSWVVLLPVEMYSILYTRDNCHAGCINARISCGSGVIISFLTLIAIVLASRYVYLTTRVFQKIKKHGVHGVFSGRFSGSQDCARSVSSVSSLDDRPSTLAPFHLRPPVQLPDPVLKSESLQPRDSSFSARDSEISVDLHKISSNVTKDIDKIILKRISRLSVFVLCLYLAAVGVAVGDTFLCIWSGREAFFYSSPPCHNSDVFSHDANLLVTLLFFIAVGVYIPARHRVIAEDSGHEESPEDVVRCSEYGPSPGERPSESMVSIAL